MKKGEMDMCWHGGVLTLDEYIREIEDIRKILFEEFQKEEEDSVYEAVLCFRDEWDLTEYGVYSDVFKHFRSVEDYVFRVEDVFDEPMDDRAFWEIVKYRLCNDEYQKQLVCWFSVDMSLLRARALVGGDPDHKYLLSNPKNVDVPYQRGDILEVCAAPFGQSFYVVYGGEAYRGQREEGLRNKRNQFYHFCVYESRDKCGLWIDDLSCDRFTDYVLFQDCPLTCCELAEDCPNQKLVEVSRKLKEDPDQWYEWVRRAEEARRIYPIERYSEL